MRRLFLLLALGVLVSTAPACGLLKAYGDLWGPQENPCAMGAGGDGAGGDDSGAGGDDSGAGGDTSTGDTGAGSDVAAGTGTGSGAGGADTGSAGDVAAATGAGAGPGERRPPRVRRRRRYRERYGTAYEADCPAPPDPIVPTLPTPTMWAPMAPPNLIPLTTTRLRAIAAAQNIGAGQTGITLNRTIGLAFENWVLTMLGQLPRYTTPPLLSPRRQAQNKANGGLPASVIPEFVSALNLVSLGWGMAPFPESELWEVKAVTGALTLATSRYQILGLIDVASMSPAGVSTIPKHPPPVVVFTITGNTTIGPDLLAEATQLRVAIWVQAVFEDATIQNDPDPDLYIGPLVPMNPTVYGTALPVPSAPSGAHSRLTSPKTPPMPVPGDPDPPEVD